LARALIVGCGCRGRELGKRLRGTGWEVRGTTRDPARSGEILDAGFEAAVADPAQAGTILDHVGDVTLVFWLLGTASAAPGVLGAIHGSRLERVLEKLVDTPVRGFVYESGGRVQREYLERGGGIVREAAARWRIPVEIVAEDPADRESWTAAMLGAAELLTRAR
jgi:nucleoside-diphosphate-sugar epimerase